jgi:large subunit ribosomal protein L6
MTRKGKLPISFPKGVDVKVTEHKVSVKGPKGQIEQDFMPGINIKVENDQIIISMDEAVNIHKKFHGLYRTLIQNMVTGSTEGFEKRLEMRGVGYRAAVQGRVLQLTVGLSHPANLDIPEGLEVAIEKNTKIIVKGIDKQKVGQFAATIRSIRKPEPYQGKGIRYVDEYVRKKAGKAAAKK